MITDTELERLERRYGEHLEHERVLYGLPQHATLDIGALISSVRELRARAEAAEAENERLRKALADGAVSLDPKGKTLWRNHYADVINDAVAARITLENTNGSR